MEPARRSGWTLIELLIVIAILGSLIAILIPAVSAVRESARRVQCSSNLRQIGLAVANYASVHGRIPTYDRNGNFSSHVALMPYLELDVAYVDLVEEPIPRVPREPLSVFVCPTTTRGVKHITYPASLSSDTNAIDGAFGFGWILRDPDRWNDPSAFPKYGSARGLAHVAFYSELSDSEASKSVVRDAIRVVVEPKPWADIDDFLRRCQEVEVIGDPRYTRGSLTPYSCRVTSGAYFNHAVPPNTIFCSCEKAYGAFAANSDHSGGVFCVYGDGHVDFVTNEIDPVVWSAQGDFR